VEHLAVHNLVLAVRDARFMSLLNQFELVTADGQGIRLALSIVSNVHLMDRVTARDLMVEICKRAAQTGLGIYLYGDEAGTIQRLRERLLCRFPNLRILGSEASVFRALSVTEDSELVDHINASGAAFVFVALGCPLQEHFVFEHRSKIRAVQLCVGSAFKIFAGDRVIAPAWMQRAGLEWVHRLCQDPKRLFVRYLWTNTFFTYLVVRSLLRSWVRLDKRDPSSARGL
jgi:N-acetylglucosaminyldiphosphoundecaprenol N-acetyl-beta-D-mannosaminyltransferase